MCVRVSCACNKKNNIYLLFYKKKDLPLRKIIVMEKVYDLRAANALQQYMESMNDAYLKFSKLTVMEKVISKYFVVKSHDRIYHLMAYDGSLALEFKEIRNLFCYCFTNGISIDDVDFYERLLK